MVEVAHATGDLDAATGNKPTICNELLNIFIVWY